MNSSNNGTHPSSRNERLLEKPLPSSEESERVILGSLLLDNDLMAATAATLRSEDFYSPLNRRVYAAMLALFEKSQTIDPILIGEELKKEGSLDSIGGVNTITNMTYGMPRFSNVGEYVSLVVEKARLRELIRECSRISEMALAGEDPGQEIFSVALSRISDLCVRATAKACDERFVPLSLILEKDFTATLDNLLAGKSSKIKTGFSKIDDAIGGGISLSDVLLLVADTGKGKSALALQLAYQIALQGVPTAFLAGEMANSENVNRLMSQVSGITNLNWLTNITLSEHQGLTEWSTWMKNKGIPLWFDHRTSDLATLAATVKSLVKREGLKVLVIDYIQLLKVDKVESRKRNERIAEASQEVKRIANDLGIAIIEVAQFNREGSKSSQATLHDLEGSGQLEKDASIVFILELEDATFVDDEGHYRNAKIRMVKGRNTGIAKIDGTFYGQTLRFKFGAGSANVPPNTT